jgi:hypothetical protein
MLPYSFIGKWDYINPATPVAIDIAMTDKPDWVIVKNLTNWGDTTAITSLQSEWFSSLPAGEYISLDQTVTTNALVSDGGITGGFTFIDQSNPPTYSKVAITAINGSTFVVTGSNVGLSVGDFVRLINVTGALELSSILYQVTSLTSTTAFTLGLAATAATAKGSTYGNGTTGFYQKVYPGFMYPKGLPVLWITKATQAKVYFARPNDFTPGELVDFQIPTPYGMTGLSNLTATPTGGATSNPPGAARVLVVTNTETESSITINYDTTGLSAFTFPSSATYAVGGNASPAVCFPAGSGIVPYNGSATIPQSPPGTNLLDAFDNHAQYVMNLGTNVVGAANAQMVVMAFKADWNNAITNA